MYFINRRRYKVWLRAVLKKDSLTREELLGIINGQLLLPARDIDTELLKKCIDILNAPESQTLCAIEEAVWLRVQQSAAQLESRKRA